MVMESERTNEVMASEVPHVAISVRSDETQEEQTQPAADLQHTGYHLVMFILAGLLVAILVFAPQMINNKSQSPFKAHAGLFMYMAIASGSMTALATGILLLASYFQQSWMKNIHYTVLKSVGMFCGLLALYSEIAVIFVPRNFNYRVHIVISIATVVFLGVYCFLWMYVCPYQLKPVWVQTWRSSVYLTVLACLLIASRLYLPHWANIPIMCIAAVIVFCFVVITFLNIPRERKQQRNSDQESLA